MCAITGTPGTKPNAARSPSPPRGTLGRVRREYSCGNNTARGPSQQRFLILSFTSWKPKFLAYKLTDKWGNKMSFAWDLISNFSLMLTSSTEELRKVLVEIN